MAFLQIPDPLRTIASQLSLPELANFCRVERYLAPLCAEEAIWQAIITRDYPQLAKPYFWSWHHFGMFLARSKWLPVVLDLPGRPPTVVSQLLVTPDVSVSDLLDSLGTIRQYADNPPPYILPDYLQQFFPNYLRLLANIGPGLYRPYIISLLVNTPVGKYSLGWSTKLPRPGYVTLVVANAQVDIPDKGTPIAAISLFGSSLFHLLAEAEVSSY